MRSTAGLKKLGITGRSFGQAYEIQRNEISDKRRAKLQRVAFPSSLLKILSFEA